MQWLSGLAGLKRKRDNEKDKESKYKALASVWNNHCLRSGDTCEIGRAGHRPQQSMDVSWNHSVCFQNCRRHRISRAFERHRRWNSSSRSLLRRCFIHVSIVSDAIGHRDRESKAVVIVITSIPACRRNSYETQIWSVAAHTHAGCQVCDFGKWLLQECELRYIPCIVPFRKFVLRHVGVICPGSELTICASLRCSSDRCEVHVQATDLDAKQRFNPVQCPSISLPWAQRAQHQRLC